MNEQPTIITERVDDIPLLLAQMDRMGLTEVLDAHFPTHGNWQGLSFGRVTTIWLSSILSRGDHRLVHVEPWAAQRQMMLSQATGKVVRAHEFSDDRLEIVLRLLSDDKDWMSFESELNQHLVRVYDLQAQRVHVDSTSASAYASVSDEGLFQFGHSKDQRPDLPQVKVMQAVLDPLGMLLVIDVVSGERADDPLYIPCIERVQASLGRSGLFVYGRLQDGLAPHPCVDSGSGDLLFVSPSPGAPEPGALEEAVASALRGDVDLRAVYRKSVDGQAERIAEGYERQVPMAIEAHGESQRWTDVASWCGPYATLRPQRCRSAPEWQKHKLRWKRSINGVEAANALKKLTTCVKPSMPLYSVTTSRTFCGCAMINSARHTRYEHTGVEPRGSKEIAKPQWKCGWTRGTCRCCEWVRLARVDSD
jgi:hypothetical protein